MTFKSTTAEKPDMKVIMMKFMELADRGSREDNAMS